MESTGTFETKSYAAMTAAADLTPFTITRRAVGDNDVHIEIAYAGICHTDIHFANNELGDCMYPIVPGHELVGIVTEVGPDVTDTKVGDRVGVGCMVDACLDCGMCSKGEENYCDNGGQTMTYGSLKGKYEEFGKTSHFLGNPET